MPWGLLFGVLGNLPGILGDYFKSKNDLEKAKLEAQVAIEQAKVQQAAAYATADLEKGNTLLGVTSPRFKQFTFVVWFLPFALAMIAPNYAKIIFENLQILPVWYTQTAITLLLSVWGINVASGVIASIFTNVVQFMDIRRQKNMPAELFFKTLRSVKGNITQAEVELYNKALDQINNQQK